MLHSSGDFVLAQIEEIEREQEKTVGFCNILGQWAENRGYEQLRSPLAPGTEVLRAEDMLIQKVLGLGTVKDGLFIGTLYGRGNLKVSIDAKNILTKHLSVLARSGSGKSYCTGVLLEELLIRKVPVVVIDPHGEYTSLSFSNTKEIELLQKLDLKPKGFHDQINEFSPDIETNPNAKPIILDKTNLDPTELLHLLPTKASSGQQGIIYGALKNMGGRVDFDDLLFELETVEESPGKWALLGVLNYVKKLKLFSDAPTKLQDLVCSGKLSIVNLRGVTKDVQEILVYKLVNDLFLERKRGMVPPFFLVIEEAHNFVPERSFGEAKSSAILRQVTSEGRKFGLGVCLISQRPSRVDKSVLSQCSTQCILKTTNPLDVRAIASAVEGITQNTEKDIPLLPIGTALLAGVADFPLLVTIRPRMSLHGGEAVDVLQEQEEQTEESDGHSIPVISQSISAKDLAIMHGKDVKIRKELVPALLVSCQKGETGFSVLIDLCTLCVIEDIQALSGRSLHDLHLEPLNQKQENVAKLIFMGEKKLNVAELLEKSKLTFSEFSSILQNLVHKGYLEKQGSQYIMSQSVEFLSTLDRLPCYAKVVYHKDEGEKQPAKYSSATIISALRTFYNIRRSQECFVERYVIE